MSLVLFAQGLSIQLDIEPLCNRYTRIWEAGERSDGTVTLL